MWKWIWRTTAVGLVLSAALALVLAVSDEKDEDLFLGGRR